MKLKRNLKTTTVSNKNKAAECTANNGIIPVRKWFLPKEYRHYLLLLYLPIYLAAFFLLERHITTNYWVSYWPALDDRIPFVSWFVIPYYIWYPYIILTGVFFMFRDIHTFTRYMYSVIIGYSLGLLICALFPNGQNLRPMSFREDSIFTRMVQAIYRVDTNTNVLPSFHVIGSFAVVSAVMNSTSTRNRCFQAFMIVMAVLICASTVFIKQHSVLDIFAGLIINLLLHITLYTIPNRSGRRKQHVSEIHT